MHDCSRFPVIRQFKRVDFYTIGLSFDIAHFPPILKDTKNFERLIAGRYCKGIVLDVYYDVLEC